MRRLSETSFKFEDTRGFLEVLFEGSGVVLKKSFSKRNIFRGLHHQIEPLSQTKIIRVNRGRILDFWMPIGQKADKKSVFYTELIADDGWCLIPSNFAHGFLTLEDTDFEYICIGEYSEKLENVYNISSAINNFVNLPVEISQKDSVGAELSVEFISDL